MVIPNTNLLPPFRKSDVPATVHDKILHVEMRSAQKPKICANNLFIRNENLNGAGGRN